MLTRTRVPLRLSRNPHLGARTGVRRAHTETHGHGHHEIAEASAAENPTESFNTPFWRKTVLIVGLSFAYFELVDSSSAFSIRSMTAAAYRILQERVPSQEQLAAEDAAFYQNALKQARNQLIAQTAEKPKLPVPVAFSSSFTRASEFSIPAGSQVVWESEEKKEED
ncbi:hypothetical protein BT69DRAFT_1276979 [Atractiella rhizophila]|nr:hypothetical protein BT69DRAFT_1276979 [Atractiella rhizophila]